METDTSVHRAHPLLRPGARLLLTQGKRSREREPGIERVPRSKPCSVFLVCVLKTKQKQEQNPSPKDETNRGRRPGLDRTKEVGGDEGRRRGGGHPHMSRACVCGNPLMTPGIL